MVNPYKYVKKDGRNQVEHRVIMQEHLGRELDIDEVVHHVNGNYKDNRIENLMVMSRSEHSKLHSVSGHEYEIIQCAYCKSDVVKRKAEVDYKRKQGVENFYCNKSCAAKHKLETCVCKPITDSLDIDEIIKTELDNGLSGYAIAKKHCLNRKTVYNHINTLNSFVNLLVL